MDTFFSGTSSAEKGTLFWLKNVFNYKNVTKDITDTFNDVTDFFHFVTTGMTVMASMELLHIETLDELPANAVQSDLDLLASEVVDMVWHKSNSTQSVLNPREDDAFTYCICKEGNFILISTLCALNVRRELFTIWLHCKTFKVESHYESIA